MKNIKIAFFDIDGTLVDMDTKEMTQATQETLFQLKERGIILCIATGRMPNNIPTFPNVTFDAFLSFNGSYCFSEEEVIFKNPIPAEDVQKIIENGRKIKRPVMLANLTSEGANGTDKDLMEYMAISNNQVKVIEDFDNFAKGEIYQIMMGGRKEEYAALLDGVHGAKITAWWDRAVDIIPADGGKGLGVEKILAYYHLTKENAIAFGDGSNDVAMLKTAGMGIAMGNATEDVKAIADDICGSVKEDGIYHYCKKHGLI